MCKFDWSLAAFLRGEYLN